ncbi:MAG: hypothetical protein JW703_03580 [Candidatus Diapherotrites archaeon]|nr:hypothetical protein [Candidatus Diapherotrites archaeon]
MFKKTVLLVLLLFSVNCFADSLILIPIESHLQANDSIELGKAMPGQTLKLIVSDNSYREDGLLWEKADVMLPSGWELVSSGKNDKTIEVLIKIPETTLPNIYNINLILSAPLKSVEKESFTLKVIITNEQLILASSPALFVEGKTGESSKYLLIVSNNSICSQEILMESSLPRTWTEAVSFIVPANSVKELNVKVVPQQTERRQFKFNFLNENKKILVSLNAVMNSKPSLEGKFYAFLAGFPVYSISLIPFNLINVLAGYLM